MKNPNSTNPMIAALPPLAVMTLLLAAAPTALAGSDTWTGLSSTTSNFSDAGNWSPVAVPAADDSLLFTGSTRTSPNNDFATGTIFDNLTFDGSASSFTLSGNGFTLNTFTNGNVASGTSPIGGSITNSSSNPQTLALPLVLSAGSHTIIANGGGQLNLSAPVTRNPGATVVFNPANGNINVTGGLSTNGFNNILGGWATFGNGWATLDANSNIVSFANYTPISSGLLASGADNNVLFSADTSNLVSATGTIINSFIAQQGVARFLTNTGVLKLGSQGGFFRNGSAVAGFTVNGAGTLTANGGGEITLSDAPFTATANNLTISCVISNDGVNAVAVNVIGYVAFSASIGTANTYSGGTFINQGRVQITPTNGFGTGPVYVFPGGEILFNSNGSYTNSFFIGGIGTTETGGLGAFRLGGAARVITGPVTLMGDATIGNNGQILGPISGGGTLSIGHGTSANGHGSVHVGGPIANSYTGDTVINGSATTASDTLFITTGFNNIMPHGAGKGNVVLNAASATINAMFDLNGTTQTINGLTNTATSPANDIITNTGAGGNLVLGDNNTTTTFAGTFAGNVSITKIGNGTQTLTGITTNTGGVTVGGGTLAYAGTATPASSANVIVTNSGILDVSAIVNQITTTNNLSLTNGTISLTVPASLITNFVVNNLNLGGTANTLNLAALPLVTSYPQTFHLIKYTTLNGAFNVSANFPVSSPAFIGFVTNNTGTSTIDLVLTGGPVPVRALTWTGNDGSNPGSWDVGSSLNWKNVGGVSTFFNQLDFAQFDDTAPGSTTVNLSTALTPSGVTVTNNTKTYTFNGSGNLSGSWSLIKQGTGLLIMDNSTPNAFAGATISGGTVQVGNNDSAGDIGTGPVVNNGNLVFDRNDIPIVANAISGSGGITQSGSGTVTLSNNNTFTGPVTVTQGVLKVGTGTSLGNTNASLTIQNGASLDLNGNNLGSKPIFVGGAGASGANLGAIDNSGLNAFPAVAFVTLTGDTTFGTSGGVGGSTTAGRWDLRAAGGDAANPTNAMLSTGGQPYNLTITGGAIMGIVSATVDPKLGNIDIQGGKLDYEGTTTGLGDPTKTITIENGAFLFLFATSNALNKNIQINTGGTVQNNNSANTIVGPISLNGSGSFCQFEVDTTTVLNLNGPITGAGNLYRNTGTGTLNLNGTNSFTGNILVSAGTVNINGDDSGVTNSTQISTGTVNLNGLLGGELIVGGGTTLSATGTNFAGADVSGNFYPGGTNVAATFTTYGAFIVESSANLNFDLSGTNTIGGGNDLVVINGDLTFNGGNININPFGLLKTGVPYRLINYSGALNLAAPPTVASAAGYNFVVDTSVPGQVNVIASGGPPVWTGGSLTDSDWSDAANFNGVSVGGGSLLFFAGNTRLNNTNDTTADTAYGNIVFPPGAGAFVLNGNPLVPSGGINNNSANPQAVDLGLDFSANVTLTGGANAGSPLIIGGGLTNTGGGQASVILAGTGTLTNLVASTPVTGVTILSMTNISANWTLADNGSSTPISVPWALNIFNGTFNFGTPTSAPNFTSTTPNGAPSDNIVGQGAGTLATFNMVNGNLTLTARLDTGASVAGSTGVVNQVGGILTVNGQFQGANIAGGVSTVNVSGGTLNIPGGTTFIASRGHGSLTVSGSAAVNLTTLDVSRGIGDGTIGVVNLNGGVLAVNNISTATANTATPVTDDTATFNFNGGVLKARQNNAAFITDSSSGAATAIPLAVIVKAGGAVIDDGGFTVSVLESLQHDATLGTNVDGGLMKQGAGILTLGSPNTYTGGTLVNGGTLVINNSLAAGAVTVNAGGNLAGTGTIAGTVTVTNGGNLSPGGVSSVGTLTVAGNVTDLTGATNTALLARGSAISNSVLTSTSGTITFAGTLVVTNTGSALATGDSFKLFNAGSYAGSFASIIPATPGPGLTWNTTNLTVNGTLAVAGSAALPAKLGTITVAGTSLTITGTGGAPGGTFRVLSSTTLTAPVSTWGQIGTGSFNSSGQFTFNGTINPAEGVRFYALVSP